MLFIVNPSERIRLQAEDLAPGKTSILDAGYFLGRDEFSAKEMAAIRRSSPFEEQALSSEMILTSKPQVVYNLDPLTCFGIIDFERDCLLVFNPEPENIEHSAFQAFANFIASFNRNVLVTSNEDQAEAFVQNRSLHWRSCG
jgi:hypothetical protein